MRALALQLHGNWYRAGQATRPGPLISQPRSQPSQVFSSILPVILTNFHFCKKYLSTGATRLEPLTSQPSSLQLGFFTTSILGILINFQYCKQSLSTWPGPLPSQPRFLHRYSWYYSLVYTHFAVKYFSIYRGRASPDLPSGFFSSSLASILRIFTNFHCLLWQGQIHSAGPDPFSWVSSPVFLVFSQLFFCQKGLEGQGLQRGPLYPDPFSWDFHKNITSVLPNFYSFCRQITIPVLGRMAMFVLISATEILSIEGLNKYFCPKYYLRPKLNIFGFSWRAQWDTHNETVLISLDEKPVGC